MRVALAFLARTASPVQVTLANAVETLCAAMRAQVEQSGTLQGVYAAPSVARVYALIYTPAWDVAETTDKDEADRLVRECYGEIKRALAGREPLAGPDHYRNAYNG